MVRERNYKDKVLSYQVDQPFERFTVGNGPLDFDSFHVLPNQFAYIVDCTCSEIIKAKGNTHGLLSIKDNDLTIDHIFNLLHPSIADDFFHDVADGFDVIKQKPVTALPLRNGLSHINTVKKVGNGYHTFLRSAYIWESDDHGIFRKTISVYTHLYDGLAKATNPSMNGPEGQLFRAEYLKPFQHTLSAREIQLLKLIAEGDTTSMMSEKLHISRRTVETHRKNMIRKLEVNNTAHLVGLSKDIGLI